jgi:hypothetical protein
VDIEKVPIQKPLEHGNNDDHQMANFAPFENDPVFYDAIS